MNTLKIFNDSEVFQKERPTITQAQEDAFYLEWAEYCFNQKWNISSNVQELAQYLSTLDLYFDAYHLAKKVEDRRIIKVNFEVCSWLDSLKDHYEIIIERNEQEWFRAHRLQYKFSKEDQIRFKKTYHKYDIGHIGVIKLMSLNGYYYIKSDKRKDLDKIPFEILENIGEKS